MKYGQANADMWLVIHIPKTAGTSLRWALEKQFGKSRIIWDYGPTSKDTSKLVSRHLFAGVQSSGAAELIQEMSDVGAKVLIGHFPLQKYADYFSPANIITLVRKPLDRICSEYLHRIDNGSFVGSFSQFLQTPDFQNLQSWFLQASAAQNIIGITDEYNASLNYFNNVFDWDLKRRRKNAKWPKGGSRFAENLSAKELGLFCELNKKDIDLYANLKQGFEANKKIFLKNKRA